MIPDRQRLDAANRLLASRMQGKTLTDINLSEYGGRIVLRFVPLQNLDSLADFSEIRLTIDDVWSTRDKNDPVVLSELSEKLQRVVENDPARPKYMNDCVLHSSDILRLYLSLGCLTVQEAVIGEDASLAITMDQGIEIHLLGYRTEKIESDEDSWMLEVQQESKIGEKFQPLEYSFAGNQDGELSGFWE